MRFAIMIFSFHTSFRWRSVGNGFLHFCVGNRRNLPSGPLHLNRRKEIVMIEVAVATLIGFVLVVGPLLWRVAKDRSESRALSIRAYVQSLVDRKLGGESFVSVQVTPRGLWRAGQVVVAVPGGWEWLLEEVWPVLMARTPRGYELVVRRGESAPAPQRQLRRVA
jgi:hypothetical protein